MLRISAPAPRDGRHLDGAGRGAAPTSTAPVRDPDGLLWCARILDRTGGRKRDVLTAVVPFVGMAVQVRAVWRYTARDVYWTPRRERRSAVLQAPYRRWAIGAGTRRSRRSWRSPWRPRR